MDWIEAFFLAIGIIVLVGELVAMIVFFSKRRLPSMRARLPRLTLLSQVAVAIWLFAVCLQRVIPSLPCLFNMWISYTFLGAVFDFYLIRIITLWVAFNTTCEMLARAHAIAGHARNPSRNIQIGVSMGNSLVSSRGPSVAVPVTAGKQSPDAGPAASPVSAGGSPAGSPALPPAAAAGGQRPSYTSFSLTMGSDAPAGAGAGDAPAADGERKSSRGSRGSGTLRVAPAPAGQADSAASEPSGVSMTESPAHSDSESASSSSRAPHHQHSASQSQSQSQSQSAPWPDSARSDAGAGIGGGAGGSEPGIQMSAVGAVSSPAAAAPAVAAVPAGEEPQARRSTGSGAPRVVVVGGGLTPSQSGNFDEVGKWYLEHRWMVSTPFLFLVFVGCLLVQSIVPIAVSIASPDLASKSLDQCPTHWTDPFRAILVAIYVLIVLFSAYKLRIVRDGFFIKSELRAVAIVAICGAVPWFILINVPGMTSCNANHFPVTTPILIITGIGISYYSLVFPVRNLSSARVDSESAATAAKADVNVAGLNSLEKLLAVTEATDAFKDFLAGEFSVENLMFYLAVRQFYVSDHLLSEAMSIYETYVASGSNLEVNLPGAISQQIREQLDQARSFDASNGENPLVQVNGRIFDRASKNIYALLETDAFPRFLQSEQFRVLRRKLLQQENEMRVLRHVSLVK